MAFQSLTGEATSVYSLTFEEFQNILGDPGAKLGSMNMDELLRNIWTAEENQAAMAFEGSNATNGMNAALQASGINNTGIISQLSIQRQGSLCLPRTLSTRTVEEVWKSLQAQPEIRDGEENSSSNVGLQTRQITLGEVTLEDFLVKAGIVQKPPISQEEDCKAENGRRKKEEEDSSSSSSRQFVGSTMTNLMSGSIQPNTVPPQGINFQLNQSLLMAPHNQQVQQGYHEMNVNLPFLAQQPPPLPKEAPDTRVSSPHNQAYNHINVPLLSQQHQQPKEAADARSASPHHHQQAQQGYHQMNINMPFMAQLLPPKEASDFMANSPHHQQTQQGFHPLSVNVPPFMTKTPSKESSDVSYGGGVIETSPRPLSTATMGGVLNNTGPTGVWLSGMRYGVATSPVSPRTEDSSPTTNGPVTRHGRKRCSEAPVEKVIERRQRRMIKNRESAARSRARKQAYTMELEAEVSHLKEENMKLLQKQQEEADRKKKQIIAQTPLVVKAGGRITSLSSSSSSSLRRTCTGPW